MAFRPLETNQQQSVPLTGRIEASGFAPLDELAASRVKPALTLEQILAEGHAGEIAPQSQPFSAFARGALNSILAGTPEAGATLAGANARSDPASPQFTNPGTFATGETLGSFVPLGRIGTAGKGLWSAIKEGARLGGIYGFGQGVSKVAGSETPTGTGTLFGSEGLGGMVPAIESGLTEGSMGVALGGSIPILAGSAMKLIPTKQNILDDLMKTTPSEVGKRQRAASGGYVQAAEKVTPFLKKDDGVNGFIDATEKALEKEVSIFKPTVEKAPVSLVNPDAIYAEADAELAKLIPNADTRNQLLLNSGDFLSDLTKINPKNLLQYASQANRELGRIYKNPSNPITTDGLAAKEAIRDAYGNAIRKILEAAGEDPGVYSGYGAIREMQASIGKNYLLESHNLSVQEAGTPLQNVISGLEVGKGGLNVGRALQGSVAAITGAEKARLDRQANKLVDGFLGFSREKTNAGKADKLSSALQFLNILNKNQAEPLTTLEEGSNQLNDVISSSSPRQ